MYINAHRIPFICHLKPVSCIYVVFNNCNNDSVQKMFTYNNIFRVILTLQRTLLAQIQTESNQPDSILTLMLLVAKLTNTN